MDDSELLQGSQEWKLARLGSVGASRVADVIAKTKTGWGASRANYAAELIVERLTGIPTEGFQNAVMLWGTEKEPEARTAYEFRFDTEIASVGLVRHPTIKAAHASPDGLVGKDGLVEIKCPNSATHIDTLLEQAIPGKYVTQMQFQMAVTGRQWCDFVSYDPRLPEAMRLFVERVYRDNTVIDALEHEVLLFLHEVDQKVAALVKRYNVVPKVLAA